MQRLPVLVAIVFGAAASIGCSSSSSGSNSGGQDAGPDVYSTCGHPGDKGNSLGVGHFCTGEADCEGFPQPMLCSVIGDTSTHFCTFMCSPPDAGTSADGGDAGAPPFPTSCGDNATCECGTGGCGCTPNQCLM